MRALVVISIVMAVFLAGCDPAGLRRVRVQLPQPTNDSGTIVIHQPDVQEALRVLDTIVEPLGFKAIPEKSTNGYIRVYMLSRPPVMVDGRSYSRDVPIRVTQTPTGIEVAFGEFGFLAATPEPAVQAFKGARAAFVSRYGSKNVKTKTFGSANKSVQATAAVPFVFEVAGDLLLPGFVVAQSPAAVPDLGRWAQAQHL
jgi:hypothetical protein